MDRLGSLCTAFQLRCAVSFTFAGAALFLALGPASIAGGESGALRDLCADESQERSRSQPTSAATTARPVRIVDEFHPDNALRADGTRPPQPAPAYGGRAIVQVEAMPRSLNGALDGIGVVRRIALETNATLLTRDTATQRLVPDVCASWVVEDRLILKDRDESGATFGRVARDGNTWIVTPLSTENPLREPLRVDAERVERVERGTVFTFRLRPDVTWHDGHPFDARDVAFSIGLYANPLVKCDKNRFQFADLERADVLDAHTIRVTFSKQYFMAEASLGDMFLLPAHLYDLSDPDNAAADPDYRAAKLAADKSWKPSPAEQAEYINSNVHNQQFVGLGPYKVVAFESDHVEARRYEGYFDPARAGYLDVLRWRAIPDTGTAFRAFVNGELDFLDWIASDDYYSDTASSKDFVARAYRGWHDTSSYWYVGWNCVRPQFADPAVRRALAQLFDFEEFKNTYYRGRAEQITGPFPPHAPSYDHGVKALPFDPAEATRALTEAGWYDRDGDGVIERDGVPFTIELAVQDANAVGLAFGARYQENLARAGITLRLAPMEMNALITKRESGDFDAVALGWAPPFESDPGQIWHSTEPGAKKGSNFVSFADDEVDALVAAGRNELDPDARATIWRAIHARVYALQPYLFCYNVPRKFVMVRALRGFESVPLDPNYVLRRWYYPAGTPGTRSSAAAKQG